MRGRRSERGSRGEDATWRPEVGSESEEAADVADAILWEML